jgi:hypothetical protein
MMFVVAAAQFAGGSCFFTRNGSEQVCPQSCCTKKPCCSASTKKTNPLRQPLAKNAGGYELQLTLAPIARLVEGDFRSNQLQVNRAAKIFPSSPPTRALLCTFLI